MRKAAAKWTPIIYDNKKSSPKLQIFFNMTLYFVFAWENTLQEVQKHHMVQKIELYLATQYYDLTISLPTSLLYP